MGTAWYIAPRQSISCNMQLVLKYAMLIVSIEIPLLIPILFRFVWIVSYPVEHSVSGYHIPHHSLTWVKQKKKFSGLWNFLQKRKGNESISFLLRSSLPFSFSWQWPQQGVECWVFVGYCWPLVHGAWHETLGHQHRVTVTSSVALGLWRSADMTWCPDQKLEIRIILRMSCECELIQ